MVRLLAALLAFVPVAPPVVVSLAAAVLLAGPAVAPAGAQTSIVAVVNGEPITTYDLAQREKLLRLTGVNSGIRQAALDELINEKVQLQAAKAVRIVPTDAQVDEAVSDLAGRVKMSASQLSAALSQQGVNIATLRERLRAQIAFHMLVRARFQATMTVTEQDLVAALLADDSLEKIIDTFEYDLEQVVIALPENPSPQRLAQAKSIAQTLRSRFTSCEAGLQLARDTREVVVRPFGRRSEAELNRQAAEAVKEVAVGHLSEPIEQPRGLVMFAVCDKKQIRSSNAAMKALEPALTEERGDAFTKQYLRQLRRDAVIERR